MNVKKSHKVCRSKKIEGKQSKLLGLFLALIIIAIILLLIGGVGFLAFGLQILFWVIIVAIIVFIIAAVVKFVVRRT